MDSTRGPLRPLGWCINSSQVRLPVTVKPLTRCSRPCWRQYAVYGRPYTRHIICVLSWSFWPPLVRWLWPLTFDLLNLKLSHWLLLLTDFRFFSVCPFVFELLARTAQTDGRTDGRARRVMRPGLYGTSHNNRRDCNSVAVCCVTSERLQRKISPSVPRRRGVII